MGETGKVVEQDGSTNVRSEGIESGLDLAVEGRFVLGEDGIFVCYRFIPRVPGWLESTLLPSSNQHEKQARCDAFQPYLEIALKDARQCVEDANEDASGNILGIVWVASEAVSKPVNRR